MSISTIQRQQLYIRAIKLTGRLTDLTITPCSPFVTADQDELNDMTMQFALETIRLGDLAPSSIDAAMAALAIEKVEAAHAVLDHIDAGNNPPKTKQDVRAIFNAALATLPGL